MILNQYHNQLNFQGGLYYKGGKLPKKKFKEVAKIFAEKSIGKPDLTLSERLAIGDAGHLYHATDVIIQRTEVASISSDSLKSMFEKISPTKLATELINLSRKVDKKDIANVLKSEINEAQKRLYDVKCRFKHSQNPKNAERLQIIIERMTNSIINKEKKYANVEPKLISNEWCF